MLYKKNSSHYKPHNYKFLLHNTINIQPFHKGKFYNCKNLSYQLSFNCNFKSAMYKPCTLKSCNSQSITNNFNKSNYN